MFIHEVCAMLKKFNVPYAIVGGYAVALHGAIRGTVDVDVAIKWSLENLKNVEMALHQLGLVSLLPVNAESVYYFRDEYIQNRNMIAWNFYDPVNPAHQVDIVITYDLAKAKTKIIKTSLGDIKILALHDLIKMKRKSGRPQDIEDIKALENL